MSFDDVLKKIREFGRYQERVYALLTLCWMIHAPFMTISVFLVAVPEHGHDKYGY